jgi:hypothetical protein
MNELSMYSSSSTDGDIWDTTDYLPQKFTGKKNKALAVLISIFFIIIMLELLLYFVIFLRKYI